MRTPFFIVPVIAAVLLSGCVASIPPASVTRFHLGQPIAAGAVLIEPLSSGDSQSLEFQTYAAAVAAAISAAGLTPGQGSATPWIAGIEVSRSSRPALRKASPITIGIGGGTGGYGSGVGLGASFGLGGNKNGETVTTRLSVRLMKRSDRSTVWEGRAETEALSSAPSAQPGLAAEKLAKALFKDFPGESGKTVLVP